jgi:flavin-dependent dehydrogenase
LGDHYTVSPPFTGNGMSMAFESAHLAAPAVMDFAVGRAGWANVAKRVRSQMRLRFRRRLLVARAIHPFLYRPALQRILASLNHLRILPFRALYEQTHFQGLPPGHTHVSCRNVS